MVYDWTQIGIKEITNFYLYGTIATPSNLLSSDMIQHDQAKVTLSLRSYMESGPGRYAYGCESPLIQAFFDKLDPAWLTPGQQYKKAQLAEILANHGINIGSYSWIIQQKNFDVEKWDWIARSYIYNTQQYMLQDDARFVVDQDGSRHIVNYAVIPRVDENGYADNFDFTGGSSGGNFAGQNVFIPNIDPYGIGGTVHIKVGNGTETPVTKDYGSNDYESEKKQYATSFTSNAVLYSSPVLLKQSVESIPKDLWDQGVIKYQYDNRVVVYGTNGSDVISSSSIPRNDLLFYRTPLAQLADSNGVVLIGGAGSDKLIGTSQSDYLVGGVGDDLMKGSIGNDKYIIVPGDGNDVIYDLDGKGSIVVGGTVSSALSQNPLGIGLVATSAFTWQSQDGTQYKFAPNSRGWTQLGTLTVDAVEKPLFNPISGKQIA